MRDRVGHGDELRVGGIAERHVVEHRRVIVRIRPRQARAREREDRQLAGRIGHLLDSSQRVVLDGRPLRAGPGGIRVARERDAAAGVPVHVRPQAEAVERLDLAPECVDGVLDRRRAPQHPDEGTVEIVGLIGDRVR